jgi:hypothetical protein
MLPELLSLPPAELARRLATVAVEARARKVAAAKQAEGVLDQVVAGAKGLWSSAQPTLQAYGNSLKSMDVSNPAVAATLGAAALGGGSAVSEAFRSKDQRRWSNVGLNAALGGLLGGAAPTAVAGLREYLTPGKSIPDTQKTPVGVAGEKVVDTAADAGQLLTGAAREARKLTSPTNVNHLPARTALNVAEYAGETARDNPRTALGAAGSLATWKGTNALNRMAAMDRGLNAAQGNSPQQKLESFLAPDMPNRSQVLNTLADYNRRSEISRAWNSQRAMQSGVRSPAAFLRSGDVPASVFQDMYRQGGGPGKMLTQRVPRTAINLAPLAIGGLLDYLAQANK